MQTITNPADPTQTYTYGVRGRKPKWVMEYEAKHGRPAVEKETVVYDIVLQDSVLTNKTLDKTYTFGTRGKRPTWVSQWIEANPDKVPAKTAEVATA